MFVVAPPLRGLRLFFSRLQYAGCHGVAPVSRRDETEEDETCLFFEFERRGTFQPVFYSRDDCSDGFFLSDPLDLGE